MEKKYRMRERSFVDEDAWMSEHLIAIVEDSSATPIEDLRNGNNVMVVLTLGDCRNTVDFYFNLGSPELRQEAIAKARMFAETLTEFREALEAEVSALEDRLSSDIVNEVFVN